MDTRIEDLQKLVDALNERREIAITNRNASGVSSITDTPSQDYQYWDGYADALSDAMTDMYEKWGELK